MTTDYQQIINRLRNYADIHDRPPYGRMIEDEDALEREAAAAIEELLKGVRIAINVYGGMVQSVYANGDVAVEVYDEDCEEYGEDRAAELNAITESSEWKQVW